MLMTVVMEWPYARLPKRMYCSLGSRSRAGNGMRSSSRSNGRGGAMAAAAFRGRGGRSRHYDAGHGLHAGAGLVGGEDLPHRLLALSAHDDVEVSEKGRRVAGRQRAAGDQQAAAAAQCVGEPQAVLQHGDHAGDADHVRMRGHGPSERLITAQEGAVQELHLVARLPHGGGHVGHAERRKAEARAVQPAPEERIDEQDRGHGVLSILTP